MGSGGGVMVFESLSLQPTRATSRSRGKKRFRALLWGIWINFDMMTPYLTTTVNLAIGFNQR